jgi:hypothetical protein
VRRVSGASTASAYHFLVYTGVFSILLQPLKIAALVILALGLAQGMDGLLGLDLIPRWAIADPAYVVGAYAKYTLIACIALFVAVPRGERASLVPIVPLYFFYAVAQIVPVSVGYANWLSLKWRGRRLFADHYQEEETMTTASKP